MELANPWRPPGWIKSDDSLGNVHDAVLIAYNNSPRPIRFAVEWHNRWIEDKLGAETTVTHEWDKPA